MLQRQKFQNSYESFKLKVDLIKFLPIKKQKNKENTIWERNQINRLQSHTSILHRQQHNSYCTSTTAKRDTIRGALWLYLDGDSPNRQNSNDTKWLIFLPPPSYVWMDDGHGLITSKNTFIICFFFRTTLSAELMMFNLYTLHNS